MAVSVRRTRNAAKTGRKKTELSRIRSKSSAASDNAPAGAAAGGIDSISADDFGSLVLAARAGSQDAKGKVHAYVTNLGRRMVRDRARDKTQWIISEEDDIAQEALLRVFDPRNKLEDLPDIKAWVVVVLKNLIVNQFRHRTRTDNMLRTSAANVATSFETIDRDAIVQFDLALLEAMRRPKELEKQALCFSALGIRQERIAILIDRTPETVRASIKRARRKLIRYFRTEKPDFFAMYHEYFKRFVEDANV